MPRIVEPAPGLPYHRLQAGRVGAGWTLLGVVMVFLGGFVVLPTIIAVLVEAGMSIAGESSTRITTLLDTDHLTPIGLGAVDLELASFIPVVLVVSWLLHGLRPGWVVSVVRRVRWRWFAVCLGLSVVTLAATLLVGALLPGQDGSTDLSGPVHHLDHTMVEFVLVILVLTPLQAAGEEFGFRGYLTQAFGSVLGRWPRLARVVAVLGPALLFALAHGTQNAPLFFDRFAFGVVSGILVIATGGLEAGIAMHVLNNFLAFGSALLVGDITTSLAETSAGWSEIPVTLTQSLVYLALAYVAARRLRLARVVPERVGEGLGGPGSEGDFASLEGSL